MSAHRSGMQLWMHRAGMIGVLPFALPFIALIAPLFVAAGKWSHARDLGCHAVKSWRLGWNGDWI